MEFLGTGVGGDVTVKKGDPAGSKAEHCSDKGDPALGYRAPKLRAVFLKPSKLVSDVG
jgi:hypothetical protein